MRKIWKFVEMTVLGGAIFLLPIAATFLIVVKAGNMAIDTAMPLAEKLLFRRRAAAPKAAIAHRAQLAVHRRVRIGDSEFLRTSIGEDRRSTAHDAMDRRRRAVLDHAHERGAVFVFQERRLTRHLAVNEATLAMRIEALPRSASMNLDSHQPLESGFFEAPSPQPRRLQLRSAGPDYRAPGCWRSSSLLRTSRRVSQLWRSNSCFGMGGRSSLELNCSNATALRTHAWRPDRSFHQSFRRDLHRRPITRPDRIGFSSKDKRQALHPFASKGNVQLIIRDAKAYIGRLFTSVIQCPPSRAPSAVNELLDQPMGRFSTRRICLAPQLDAGQ